MKIGILTQPLSTNYGGILQNYALQTILQEMGHEVYTIDRKSVPMSFFRKCFSLVKRFLLRLSGKHIHIRNWHTKKERCIMSQETQHFINDYIKKTQPIHTTKQLISIHNEFNFDAYIVGSDQVWRPKYSPCLTNYYLDFIIANNSIKKIAYAASFGIDAWEFTQQETRTCSHLAKQFDAISVREESGIYLCKNYLSVAAVHVLDPTMLLGVEKYGSLLNENKTSESKGNLFAYILDKTENKTKIIQKIADNRKLTPFELIPKHKAYELRKKDIQKCIIPNVTQWIRAFMDAEYVVTDSFHGTVFSIIFRKPFISLSNNERGVSRFISLLKLFELEERLISSEDKLNFKIIEKSIDYNKVFKILNEKRNESIEFLKSNLNKL